MRVVAAVIAAASIAFGGLGHAATSVVVPPLPLPGPYAVACSNVVQDFARMTPGEDVQAYWEGVPRGDGSPRYITDLMADAGNTLAVIVKAPNDSELYGSFAGRSVPYVVLVCHPTATADPRPDYALPTGKVVPHMQRGAEPPLWPDAGTRYPILLFSHGYIGSPLSNDYINALSILASFGYVVVAPFHGDPRFTDTSLDSVGDVFYLLTHLTDFIAMQALRPLSLSASLDLLLAHPQWRDRVDPARIGGFGASMGGESVMLMAGAGLTKTFGQSWSQVTNDPRLKAAVGYVPYFGQPIFPAFGRGQHGLDGVALPYLAISGTSDTLAPLVPTLQGMNQLAGTREMVALVGVKHGFDIPSTNDIFTWTVTFLDAEVRGDPAARARLTQMANVAGGGDDVVILPYNALSPPNFGGLWWNAPAGSEPGWGLAFAHQGDTLFASWYTFDVDGSPLWMVVAATMTAPNVYSGQLYRATGPAFGAVPFNPGDVVGTPVGTATFTFSGNDDATFAFTVGEDAQVKQIVRQVFATPVPTCTWGTQTDFALATNFQDLWWAKPAGVERGWGINIAHQGNTLFGTWYTYGLDGKPLWLAVAAPMTAAGVYSGRLYTGTGPAFNAAPFDPAKVASHDVGDATFAFADGNNATFSYSVNGIAQSRQITREVFASPGTICQ
jgi:dienelactone hydrolase